MPKRTAEEIYGSTGKKGTRLSEAQLRWRDENYRRSNIPMVSRRPHNYDSTTDAIETIGHEGHPGERTPQAGPSRSQSHVRNIFASPNINDIDPELLLDEWDTVDAGQGSSGGSGGGGGALADNLPASKLVIHRSLRCPGTLIKFHRSGIYTTWGYAHSAIDKSPGSDYTTKRVAISTPLAYVPVDFLPFYISEQEFLNLPQNSSVKEVRCTVTCLGTRVSFDTGTTLSTAANNSHVIFGQHVIGLNKQLNICNYQYPAVAATPMVPNTVTPLNVDDLALRIYGKNAWTADDTNFTSFPTVINTIRTLSAYACLYDTYLAGTIGEGQRGLPRLDKVVDMYNHTGMLNERIINYKYRPNIGILKCQSQHLTARAQNTFNVGYGDNGQCFHTAAVANEGNRSSNYSRNTNGTLATTRQRNVPGNWKSSIEKGFNFNRIGDTYKQFGAQPQVHIGIAAVQANTPTDGTPSFVNASAYYQIETEIDIWIGFDEPYVSSQSMSEKMNTIFLTDNTDVTLRQLSGYTHFGLLAGNYPVITPVSKPATRTGL